MRPSLALSIGAVAAAAFGLALLLAPAQLLAGFGLGTAVEGQVLSRDLGVTLIAIAIVNWLARDATGPAVRAILIGNLFLQLAELVVNGYEMAVAILPMQAAGGLVIHLALAIVFWLGLRRA